MLDELSQLFTKIGSDEINCFDLIKCVFNLNETDIKIIQSFSGNQGKTIKEITKIVGKDRSTVHRSLEKLISCHLCYKERKSGETRGFVDYYYLIPIKDILEMVESNLDKCYSKIKRILDEFKEKKFP